MGSNPVKESEPPKHEQFNQLNVVEEMKRVAPASRFKAQGKDKTCEHSHVAGAFPFPTLGAGF